MAVAASEKSVARSIGCETTSALTAITSDRVEAYKAARLAVGAAAATMNRELAMLRRGFRLGFRYGRVAVRPAFSLLREDNARQGFFELEQFQA